MHVFHTWGDLSVKVVSFVKCNACILYLEKFVSISGVIVCKMQCMYSILGEICLS